MHVAILGAGNIGQTLAAYLHLRGHSVTVWTHSGTRGVRTIRTSGKVSTVADISFEPSMAQAVNGAEAIVSAVPAHALRDVLGLLASFIIEGQVVLVTPAPSASPLILSRALDMRGVHAPVAGLAATVLTSRLQSDGGFLVGALRSSIGLACVNMEETAHVRTMCETLFGGSFKQLDDMVALALAYVTPVVHGPLMLCNLSRIEKGEAWKEFECTTPAISRLVEALDGERLEIAQACSVQVPSFVDHCNASFGTQLDKYQAIAETVSAERSGGPTGPVSLHARQIAEDMPYGLAVYARLGVLSGVKTPLIDSVLTALSALCGRAFSHENGMLDLLDLAFSSPARSRNGRCAIVQRGNLPD